MEVRVTDKYTSSKTANKSLGDMFSMTFSHTFVPLKSVRRQTMILVPAKHGVHTKPHTRVLFMIGFAISAWSQKLRCHRTLTHDMLDVI